MEHKESYNPCKPRPRAFLLLSPNPVAPPGIEDGDITGFVSCLLSSV